MGKVKIMRRKTGSIHELHGVNCAPYSKKGEGNQPLIGKIFGYAGIPRSRLHDVCGSYGGSYYVDIPNIFRDFDADEYSPDSYDFHYTDEYIAAIIHTGAQIVYRLGITIEWGSKKYRSFPPKDFRKWAVICEHIIRHYNEGWNNGFHYNIEYWEIWNEPENPPMWQGTKEQFFELYKTASIHLKRQFPGLKIGGYGSCGFYAVFRKNMSAFHQSFVTYFDDFLKMAKQEGCPLDFFSWHIYTKNVDEVKASAMYVREKLDAMGFVHTESHLNEWNYGPEGGGFLLLESLTGASFAAAALITMQESKVDMAQYYVLSTGSRYNGFINLRTQAFSPVIHVFAAFSNLFKARDQLDIEKGEDEPYMLAADDGEQAFCLISNYQRSDKNMALDLSDFSDKICQIYELKDGSGFREIQKRTLEKDTMVYLDCPVDSVYYLTINKHENSNF